MAVVVVGADRSGVELEVRAEERLRVPNWFGEAVLWGQYWLDSGLVGYLEEEVRVVRGRLCVSRMFLNINLDRSNGCRMFV